MVIIIFIIIAMTFKILNVFKLLSDFYPEMDESTRDRHNIRSNADYAHPE